MTQDVAELEAVREELGLGFYELWIAYVGVGGRLGAFAVRGHLTGHLDLPDLEHDHLVLALNEVLVDLGQDRPLPYRLR